MTNDDGSTTESEVSSAAYAAAADIGFVNIEASDNTLTVTTCYQNDCTTADTDHVVNVFDVAE